MLRLRAALLLGLLSLTCAGASPATDLFGAATRIVKNDYYGWATQNFSLLTGEYASKLAEKCAPQGDSCNYTTGRDVLTDLFKAFGDLHTNVRDPEAAQRLREVMEDQAVPRSGVQVVRVEGGLLVASVMPGSPAEQGGIRRFDLFTQVNGQEAGKRDGENAPIGPNDFIRLERSGVPLSVTLRRAGQADQIKSLTTASLKARDVPTLAWAGQNQKVAVIQLPTFLASDSAALFLAKVKEAQSAGAAALVVDLRYNGGGNLAQCVAAASVFAPVVYQTKFRVGGYSYAGLNGASRSFLDTLFREPAGERVWNGPSAVLVGPNTASCAEVFSFYAQQAGAKVVGEPTKGVGNSGVIFEPLPDGGVVAVTVLRAFDETGKALPASITPNILAPTDMASLTLQGRDTTLDAALVVLSQPPGVPTPLNVPSGATK